MTGVAELRLDGNAVGGIMLELFGLEATAMPCVCAGCGAQEEVARLDLYTGAGIVIRCCHCEAVMIRIVEAGERIWLDLSGTISLELTRP